MSNAGREGGLPAKFAILRPACPQTVCRPDDYPARSDSRRSGY